MQQTAVEKNIKGVNFKVTPEKITAIRNGKATTIDIEKGVFKNIEFPINQYSILAVVTKGTSAEGFSDISDVHWEMVFIDKQNEVTFVEIIDEIDFQETVTIEKKLKGINFQVTSDKIIAIRNGKETSFEIEKGIFNHAEFPINQHSILAFGTKGISEKGFSEIADVHWEMMYINNANEVTFAQVIEEINF
jgi:hypothetical protein